MEAVIAAASTNQHGPAAAALDRQVDRAITGVELYLDAPADQPGDAAAAGLPA